MNISKVSPRLFLGPFTISIYFFKILNCVVSSSCTERQSPMQQMLKGLKTYAFFYARIIFFFRMKTKQETFSLLIGPDSSCHLLTICRALRTPLSVDSLQIRTCRTTTTIRETMDI